jgi:hypothetical protein
MIQILNLFIRRFSITFFGNAAPQIERSPHVVTKEEILKIFVKELPEPSPKREAWQSI